LLRVTNFSYRFYIDERRTLEGSSTDHRYDINKKAYSIGRVFDRLATAGRASWPIRNRYIYVHDIVYNLRVTRTYIHGTNLLNIGQRANE
jgi:hypothetical protein